MLDFIQVGIHVFFLIIFTVLKPIEDGLENCDRNERVHKYFQNNLSKASRNFQNKYKTQRWVITEEC